MKGIIVCTIILYGLLNPSFSYAEEKCSYMSVSDVQLEGRISMKGNVPFNYLVLTTESGTDYKLVGKKLKLLAKLQGQPVQLTGKKNRESMGPGFPAEVEICNFQSIPPKKDRSWWNIFS